MDNQILFIGLDVDDKAFHVCGRAASGQKQFEFSCRPSGSVLEKKLRRVSGEGVELRICYEATYLGFSLQRDLMARGLHCDVIAPSLVPVIPGEKVKTNRLDAQKLSDYYSKNQLTIVRVPNAAEEAVRDLIRGRRFLTGQLKRQKQYVVSLCRRMGLDYRATKPGANYWTYTHFTWLDMQINQARYRELKFNLGATVAQVRHLQAEISSYEVEIHAAASEPFYRRKVQALCCMRGISVISAITLITELGDINRFHHPSQITSFVGMDLCEYSSGETKRWGMTKMGNPYARTAAIESAQSAWRPPKVSKELKKRREGADPRFIDIGERCMRRLHKKATRLIFAGKHRNKVKGACARELLCFVWEALRAAA